MKLSRNRGRALLGYLALMLVAALSAGLAVRSVVEALDLPEVRVSYGTGQCVEVVDHRALHHGVESEWSCDRLPPRYERVWVQ